MKYEETWFGISEYHGAPKHGMYKKCLSGNPPLHHCLAGGQRQDLSGRWVHMRLESLVGVNLKVASKKETPWYLLANHFLTQNGGSKFYSKRKNVGHPGQTIPKQTIPFCCKSHFLAMGNHIFLVRKSSTNRDAHCQNI